MISNEGQYIKKVCDEVHLLLLEDRIAEAASLLFEINKEDSSFWYKAKIALYKSAVGHRELFVIASLIGVAEKDELDQSYHLVPGLFALRKQNHDHSKGFIPPKG